MSAVDDVAAAFLAELGPMSTMKLQKLCYYAQAWSLACDDTPLFDEPIEAWKNGPVVRSLWQQRRGHRRVADWPSGDASQLSDRTRARVLQTCKQYGHLDGDTLSDLSHLEGPWNVTRDGLPENADSNEPIRPEVMAEYYRRQMSSPAEIVEHAIGSAALEGATFDAEFKATLSAVAHGTQTADDAIAEIARRYSLA